MSVACLFSRMRLSTLADQNISNRLALPLLCLSGTTAAVRTPFRLASTATMRLLAKAGADGVSRGDCPFAHACHLVATEKGLDCQVVPCSAETKPEWLLRDFEGKMPCLDDNGHRMIESSAIVKYLEQTYPDPGLDPGGRSNSVLAAAAGFFPAMAKMLKAGEFDYYAEKAFLSELSKLEELLASESGQAQPALLVASAAEGNARLTLADCSLAPKLYHMKVAMGSFYPDTMTKVDSDFPHVCSYMSALFSTRSFASTKCEAETVVWGWTQARLKAAEGNASCADKPV